MRARKLPQVSKSVFQLSVDLVHFGVLIGQRTRGGEGVWQCSADAGRRGRVAGLCRYDRDGLLTQCVTGALSTLANPVLQPSVQVVLSGLCIALPPGFHEVFRTTFQNVPQMKDKNLVYKLRIGVHNGRVFVKKAAVKFPMTYVPSVNVLECNRNLKLDFLPADQLTALMFELQLTAQTEGSKEQGKPLVVAFAPHLPFHADCPQGVDIPYMREGPFNVVMRTGGKGWFRTDPPLDWRGIAPKSNPDGQLTVPIRLLFELSSPGTTARPPRSKPKQLPAPIPLRMPMPDEYSAEMHSAATKIQSRYRGNRTRGEPFRRPREMPEPTAREMPAPLLMPEPSREPQQHLEPKRPPEVIGVLASQQAEQLAAVSKLHQRQLDQLASLTQPAETMQLVAVQQQTQLANLAAAMQAQLSQLAEVVAGLKDKQDGTSEEAAARAIQGKYRRHAERKRFVQDRERAARTIQGKYRDYGARRDRLRELQTLKQVPATEAGSRYRPKFSGGSQGPTMGFSGPSRAARARIHRAGAGDALPADVRAMLRRKAEHAPGPVGALNLQLEARDIRVRSEVIFQVLAYKRHDAFNVPTSLSSLYFAFQFFDFPPTISERVRIKEGEGTAEMGMLMRDGGSASDPPGLLLKYVVGGAAYAEDPEILQERRMHFAKYLESRLIVVRCRITSPAPLATRPALPTTLPSSLFSVAPAFGAAQTSRLTPQPQAVPVIWEML
ncbi:hypothetical protein CYMTET_7581 [Cymbomonas tetramitiformis]|uniref:NPHP4 C2-like domain-containing protein n=1 Tax=Cymbomonas tetramitiformis TaxID=36881 RepID=A0AAE0GVE4_9CHLO|nr:hypothetical protein CYMTET_7581 [Cymbomonas tetramitiformis]